MAEAEGGIGDARCVRQMCPSGEVCPSAGPPEHGHDVIFAGAWACRQGRSSGRSSTVVQGCATACATSSGLAPSPGDPGAADPRGEPVANAVTRMRGARAKSHGLCQTSTSAALDSV